MMTVTAFLDAKQVFHLLKQIIPCHRDIFQGLYTKRQKGIPFIRYKKAFWRIRGLESERNGRMRGWRGKPCCSAGDATQNPKPAISIRGRARERDRDA
ncbi:hypothetical protein LDENG_00231420 [Lucifuga dentata]|nr:hypothetical protein LDENG_00231420 [Lucifuga dentata]